MTTRMMFDLSNQRAREEAAVAVAEQTRTQYVVKLKIGVYARANRSWSQSTDDALRFDFMTIATAHAIMELGLSDEAFTVEPV